MPITYTKRDQGVTYTVGTGAPTHSGSTGDQYIDTTSGFNYTYTTSWQALSTGGLTYFTETGVTTSPNATIPVAGLIATSASTNIDFAIVPKGTGALTAAIADGTTAGGNKRGQYAVDLQTTRTNADQVASGNNSIVIGSNSKASSAQGVAIGTGALATSSGIALQSNGNVTGGGATASNAGSFAVNGGTASAQWSFAISRAVASGINSFAFGGYYVQVTASGDNSLAISEGNTASGTGSVAIGGYGNVASGVASYAMGNSSNAFSIAGRNVFGYTVGNPDGSGTISGNCQKSTLPLGVRTTGNTATALTVGGQPLGSQVTLSNNSAYGFTGTIVGKQSGTTNACMWKITGLIARGANAASTTLTFSSVDLVSNNPGWGTPVLSANTTSGGLQVQVIGSASTNIQWTCMVETTEVIYG
jgi:hypothetical protein